MDIINLTFIYYFCLIIILVYVYNYKKQYILKRVKYYKSHLRGIKNQIYFIVLLYVINTVTNNDTLINIICGYLYGFKGIYYSIIVNTLTMTTIFSLSKYLKNHVEIPKKYEFILYITNNF